MTRDPVDAGEEFHPIGSLESGNQFTHAIESLANI